MQIEKTQSRRTTQNASLCRMDNVKDKIKNRKPMKGVDEPLEYVKQGDREIRHKVNKTQKALRVQQVVSWLLDGNTYMEVAKLGASKWGVSERTVERYIADAREQVEAMAATEIRGATTLALYRLTELYFSALASEDYKTALDVVKTQNRMLGLNAPDKIEAKTVEDWNSMSVAEQLEQVSKILERSGVAPEGADGAREVN